MNPKYDMDEQKILKTLKEEDPIQFQFDDSFFDQLENQIMSHVEKTEVKQLNRWAKTWVFLEKKITYYRPSNNAHSFRAMKLSIVSLSVVTASVLTWMSVQLMQISQQQFEARHRTEILKHAVERPQDWVNLAAQVQKDSDFYAEIANEKLSPDQLAELTDIKDL